LSWFTGGSGTKPTALFLWLLKPEELLLRNHQ